MGKFEATNTHAEVPHTHLSTDWHQELPVGQTHAQFPTHTCPLIGTRNSQLDRLMLSSPHSPVH